MFVKITHIDSKVIGTHFIYTVYAEDINGMKNVATGVVDQFEFKKSEDFLKCEIETKDRAMKALYGNEMVKLENQLKDQEAVQKEWRELLAEATSAQDTHAEKEPTQNTQTITQSAEVLTPVLTPVFCLTSEHTQENITRRLNVYRKDVIQTGGIAPSKSMGVGAKWEKYLKVKVPDRELGGYVALLDFLDALLAKSGPAAVVAAIEEAIK